MNEESLRGFTLSDRLEHGLFTLDEVKLLAKIGNTKLYQHINEGRLRVVKRGKSTRVPGPEVKRYLTAVVEAA